MKVNVKHMKNIPLAVEIGDPSYSESEIKTVKKWMKETKEALPDYVNRMADKAEKELKILFTKIYDITAIYYSDYDMPVIAITGKGFERSNINGTLIFVEAFTNDGAGTLENRYTKTK